MQFDNILNKFSIRLKQIERDSMGKIKLTSKFFLNFFEVFEKIEAGLIAERKNILDLCTFILKHDITHTSNNQHISK